MSTPFAGDCDDILDSMVEEDVYESKVSLPLKRDDSDANDVT